MPKRALTAFAGLVASARAGALTTAIIRWFVGHYGVNMSEAIDPDIRSYRTFNEFFTRAFKPGARPIADADLVCPIDGAISQLGRIERDRIFQAKGHDYTTTTLVGGDVKLAATFENGSFVTLYLSPKDYHRIHMPCAARLVRMIHVPGDLFSVNPATVRGVPGLFARNERVVCVFSSPQGAFAMVLVGATIVGSVATVWHGVVTPPRSHKIRDWTYTERAFDFEKGDEMGRFLLGSTVVMLFPPGPLRFDPSWAPEKDVRMGEPMASLGPAAAAAPIPPADTAAAGRTSP